MKSRQRRMKGEGSITKIPSGKYRVRLEVSPSPLGKRQWLTAVVATQKEATSKLQEFQRQKENETIKEETTASYFSSLIEPYVAFKSSEGLLQSSLYRLEQHLLKASQDFFEYMPVQKITTEFLQQTVINTWRQEGNKESSIKIKFNILDNFFDWLYRQKKMITKNPCADVVLKRQKKMKHQKLLTISQDEHEKLKEAMKEQWDPNDKNFLKTRFLAVYLLAYETGMREGEIAGLRIKNIDTDNNSVSVQSNLTIVRGQLIDNPPKTAAGYREIVISENTMSYLKEVLKGREDKTEDYVFASKEGRPFNPPTYLTVFKKFQKEIGMEHPLKFHSIRHTNASIMIDKNIPTPIVTERLGHSSVAITYNTYAHALRDSEERKKPLVEA